MIKKLLIAYGSAAGSTAEVADAIGEEMRQGGAIVDVLPVEEIKDISGYDGVVIGSAVRITKLLSKTRKFLRKNRRQLKQLPLAYFLVCMTMAEDTPENVEKTTEFAKPLLALKEPVSLGLFGGCMDPDKLSGMFAKMMESQPKEDKRDWDTIRAWARETLAALSEA
ncbi:flavodoxin domain-containing protein [bacterium]|nr:flavodoxin domain-containing protein [bacterium]